MSLQSGVPLSNVQEAVELTFTLSNFPNFKMNLESTSLMQSLINRKAGFLLHLSNLIVVEVISSGSFSKKQFYKPACQCETGQDKCTKYTLLDCVKENDDLSKYPFCYIPKCKLCNRLLEPDRSRQVFWPYKLVQVRTVNNMSEAYMVYFEGHTYSDVAVGSVLQGIFYLDSISKLNAKYQLRFVGDFTNVLLAVQLNRNPSIEIFSGKADSSLFQQIRQLKTFRSSKIRQNSMDKQPVEDLIEADLKIAASNFMNIFFNFPADSYFHMLFDICFSLLVVWHSHTVVGDKSKSITRLALADDQLAISDCDLMDASTSDCKMNLLVFDSYEVAQSAIFERMKVVTKGIVNFLCLPASLDEDTLKSWLVINSHAVVVVFNYNLYPPKVRSLLSTALEKRAVFLEDCGAVQLHQSFVFVLSARESLKGHSNSEFKSYSMIDCFDLCVDLAWLNDSFDQGLLESGLDELLGLYSTGRVRTGLHEQAARAGSKHPSASRSSQNSRISMLCNKICQKMVIKPSAQPVEKASRERDHHLARSVLLSYSSAQQQDARLSQRNLLSLKKIALSGRILRTFCLDDAKTLERILRNEFSGKFEIDVFDALFSVLLFENSRLSVNPLSGSEYLSLATNSQTTVTTPILNSVLGSPQMKPVLRGSYQEFSYFEAFMDDVKQHMFRLVDFYL